MILSSNRGTAPKRDKWNGYLQDLKQHPSKLLLNWRFNNRPVCFHLEFGRIGSVKDLWQNNYL